VAKHLPDFLYQGIKIDIFHRDTKEPRENNLFSTVWVDAIIPITMKVRALQLDGSQLDV